MVHRRREEAPATACQVKARHRECGGERENNGRGGVRDQLSGACVSWPGIRATLAVREAPSDVDDRLARDAGQGARAEVPAQARVAEPRRQFLHDRARLARRLVRRIRLAPLPA